MANNHKDSAIRSIIQLFLPLLLKVLLLLALLGEQLAQATSWFEEPPDVDDPCTIVIPPRPRRDMSSYHPSVDCMEHGGVLWYATYGRVHLWFYYDSDRTEEKRRNFEFCLTAGSPDRVIVWRDTTKNSWASLAFPFWKGPIIKSDQCITSVNGTLDIFLDPPWAYVNYVSHVSWNATFVEENATDVTTETQTDDANLTE